MIELLLSALLAAGAEPHATTLPPDEILVVDEDDRTRMWRVVSAPPITEDLMTSRPKDACVSVGFIIESDGTTSTHRVLRSKPKGEIDAAALATLKKWRFKPGPENPGRIPMYTTALFTAGYRAQHEAPLKIGCLVEIVVPGQKRRRPHER
jgi:TonB family protein